MIDLTTREGRQKFYQSKEWRIVREQILIDNPLCIECYKKGKIEPATVVDHIKDVSERPELRLEISNLQGLCEHHHNTKTAKRSRKIEPRIIGRKELLELLKSKNRDLL